jgi:hypothetical protein
LTWGEFEWVSIVGSQGVENSRVEQEHKVKRKTKKILGRLGSHTAPRPHLTCPRKGSPLDTTCSACQRKGHDKDECNSAAPTPLYSTARITVFGRLKNGSSPCPLSGCMSETPSVPTTSSSAPTVGSRNFATLSTWNFLTSSPIFVTRLERAASWTPSRNYGQLPPSNPSSWSALALAVKLLAEGMNWASVKGLSILFHCLLAEPWTPTRYHLAVNDPSGMQPEARPQLSPSVRSLSPTF